MKIGRTATGAAVTLLMTACQQPPRSASYFEAHPAERVRAQMECRDGRRRGDECRNAELGRIAAEREVRMRAWKSLFAK